MESKTTLASAESIIRQNEAVCHAPITIFAIPKAFTGDSVRIQSNAIASWRQLSPAVDVLLFGDEAGIAEFADSVGAFHESRLERNDQGTPLVSSAFARATELSSSPVLVYCNADVILGPDFPRSIEQLSDLASLDQWLAIGQRTDLPVDANVDFDDPAEAESLWHDGRERGVLSSRVCKESVSYTHLTLPTKA